MAYINHYNFICKSRRKVLGRVSAEKKCIKPIWIIKADPKPNIRIGKISFSNEWIGKRIMIKVMEEKDVDKKEDDMIKVDEENSTLKHKLYSMNKKVVQLQETIKEQKNIINTIEKNIKEKIEKEVNKTTEKLRIESDRANNNLDKIKALNGKGFLRKKIKQQETDINALIEQIVLKDIEIDKLRKNLVKK